jgi:hypothetical protein
MGLAIRNVWHEILSVGYDIIGHFIDRGLGGALWYESGCGILSA